MEEELYERLIEQILENPDILEELKDRIENDDIVDLE